MAEQARDLAREALNAAGYFQHHRGGWRKSRVRRDNEAQQRGAALRFSASVR
jgi:hypothetical protein